MLGMEWVFGPMMVTTLLGVFTVLLLYWYATRNHDYWKKKGVPFVKPLPFVGSIWEIMKKPIHEVENERYRNFGSVYGHYEGSKPLLSVGDPKLLKMILVKDFQNFPGGRIFETNDPVVAKMLSFVRGEDWKRVRSIITPTFSTGKIKRMLGVVKDCADTLVTNFKTTATQGKPVDAKGLYGAYTMDIIASAAFSTKIDSHNNPDNQFLRVVKKAFGQKLGFKFFVVLAAPWLTKIFKIKIFPPDCIDFFKQATLQIIQERKRTGQVRNDFLQLMMDTAKEVDEDKSEKDIPKKDIVEKDSTDKEKDFVSNYGDSEAGYHIFKTTIAKKLSMDELVGQSVSFFIAGYETTGSTLAFATYLLALNPAEQDKLREEVDQVIEENNGKLTYEAVQSMKYLDNVISETLRIFPPAIRTERVCEEDYELADSGITINKGIVITIPIYAMHRDPSVFTNPEKFDPDRFTPEERAKRDPYTYLPFGAGPRNCVGMRFALVEIKVALAMVVANFRIKRSSQTKVPVEFFMSQLGLLRPKEILVDLEIRSDCPLVQEDKQV